MALEDTVLDSPCCVSVVTVTQKERDAWGRACWKVSGQMSLSKVKQIREVENKDDGKMRKLHKKGRSKASVKLKYEYTSI